MASAGVYLLLLQPLGCGSQRGKLGRGGNEKGTRKYVVGESRFPSTHQSVARWCRMTACLLNHTSSVL
ncbi:hypothetical protein EYF80_049037 [Liparis tanakae]|uniref:Secreted protein n=1 Tax=Liparis tanakae TaxID=230148 RepID=A0A4Z2FHS5_9TELE|nr:hypothetical protein EYF80_049037 [Liparis tanakae]